MTTRIIMTLVIALLPAMLINGKEKKSTNDECEITDVERKCGYCGNLLKMQYSKNPNYKPKSLKKGEGQYLYDGSFPCYDYWCTTKGCPREGHSHKKLSSRYDYLPTPHIHTSGCITWMTNGVIKNTCPDRKEITFKITGSNTTITLKPGAQTTPIVSGGNYGIELLEK